MNASAAEIAIHEMGHSFAGLGDEYTSAFPGYPDTEEPNTTRETNRAQIKWNTWILPATPVPTPATSAYSSAVGLFEGAHYHTTNWYRPRLDCKMRTLGVAFCEVCAETLVRSVYDRLDPIDTATPPTNTLVALTNAQPVTLSVARLQPSTHPLAVQWNINNTPRAGATNATLTLAAWDMAPGTNIVRADVSDKTTLVRTDPQQKLRDSRSWLVVTTLVAPRLSIQRTNNLVSISWPPIATGFLLESKPDFNGGTLWTTLTAISNQTSVQIVLTNEARFFRLRQP
jgi:hypothetical protein